MKPEQAIADIEIGYGEKVIRRKCLVDTGTSRSIISKTLAEDIGSFIPLREAYEFGTADKEGKLEIIGHCVVDVVFQGVKVPGGTMFEVAENLREEVELIIGRPEIDTWDIIFTPEGPRPRKVPIEFEVI